MDNVIRLLPDSVANQIAAGEVVQRPASVVKELMENAVDAGAERVTVVVRGSGRQSIAVTDDGRGMTETDARLAFERHATSKISRADDLLDLHTLGFRGEALASIAAVAQVELRTRRPDDSVGTFIRIDGSEVIAQEPSACPAGTSITVSNLFFNIPARRKFLKSDETEMKNIVQEFNRVAVAHPGVGFRLYSGDECMADFMGGSFRSRLEQMFGRRHQTFATRLIPIHSDTTLVRIDGFVTYPEQAARNARQYFVANDRFIIHPRFRAAVRQAYDRMIGADVQPAFFVKLEVPPSEIDINIHPTKTEVKFANENEIYSILLVTVREALGKFNIANTMDFEAASSPDRVDIPVYRPDADGRQPDLPGVTFDPTYNPFRSEPRIGAPEPPRNWQQLFDSLEQPAEPQPELPLTAGSGPTESVYYRQRWLCIPLKSGLALIDVPAARYRIEYERLIAAGAAPHTEQTLFDQVIELDEEQCCIFTEIQQELEAVGFRLEQFGPRAFRLTGYPAILADPDKAIELLHSILDETRSGSIDVHAELRASIADRLARYSARIPRARMTAEERDALVAGLFACSNPNNAPNGRRIIRMIDLDN